MEKTPRMLISLYTAGFPNWISVDFLKQQQQSWWFVEVIRARMLLPSGSQLYVVV